MLREGWKQINEKLKCRRGQTKKKKLNENKIKILDKNQDPYYKCHIGNKILKGNKFLEKKLQSHINYVLKIVHILKIYQLKPFRFLTISSLNY